MKSCVPFLLVVLCVVMYLVGADALAVSDSISEKHSMIKKIIAEKRHPPDIHKMFTERPLSHVTKPLDTRKKLEKKPKTVNIHRHHKYDDKKRLQDYTPF